MVYKLRLERSKRIQGEGWEGEGTDVLAAKGLAFKFQFTVVWAIDLFFEFSTIIKYFLTG